MPKNMISGLLSLPLRTLITSWLFPREKTDIFAKHGGFIHFFYAQQRLPENSAELSDCEASEFLDEEGNLQISTTLASSSLSAGIGAIAVRATDTFLERFSDGEAGLPAIGKTIILFNGACDRYETGGTLKDMALLAKITGARVVAFNYSGIGKSATPSDKVRVNEFNDMVNNGISVVNFLLRSGVHPDNLIMLGDSFGSATAGRVQQEFRAYNINLRLIASNTFSSFREVIYQEAASTGCIFGWLLSTHTVGESLSRIGWDATTSDHYTRFSPYNYFLQRRGDRTLRTATLRAYINSNPRYLEDLMDEETVAISKLTDRCEVRLAPTHELRLVTELARKKDCEHATLAQAIDSHPLPLHFFAEALETIKEYINLSNIYISRNPQSIDLMRLPLYLTSFEATQRPKCT